MKQIVLLTILMGLFFYCFPQDTINKNELFFEGSLTVDNVSNLNGGIKRGNNTLGLLDVSTYYYVNNGFLKNTSFHAHILKTAGGSPSENLIGDIQIASNIEGKAHNFIYELLISYKINNFDITVGMHDLNSEFIVSNYASNFINSSFGIFPTVSINFPTSIYPITTFGGLISFSRHRFDIAGGVYNLNYEFIENESFETEDHFFQKGFFTIGEFRYRWYNDVRKIAEIKTGGFFKRGNHEDDEAKPDLCVSEKNYGFYFLADYIIKDISANKTIASFIQIGHAPTRINFSSEYYGIGISLISQDEKYFPRHISLALAHVKLNDLVGDKFVNSGRHETTLEVTSDIQFFNYFVLQPDIQYIISPSGGMYNNSLAAILRLIVNFAK